VRPRRATAPGGVLPAPLLEAGLLVAAVVLPAAAAVVSGSKPDTPEGVAAYLGLVLAAVAVLLRRRRPLLLLAATMAGSAVLIAVTRERTPLMVAMLVLLYTVASRYERRIALLAGAATTTTLYLVVAVRIPGAALGPEGLATVAWTSLAVAVGDAVRNRRAYVAAVEERARRAEETREEEARRRVAEERLRIARDLHDVVAHRMAVINVHAGVASQLLTVDPARATAALEEVQSSASIVLRELGGLLHVLRTSEEETNPRSPTPGFDELDALVASFTAVGLDIERVERGQRNDADETVELTLYRLVQEALTNAHRHGTGGVRLVISNDRDHLDVEVTNGLGARSGAPEAAAEAAGAGAGAGLGLLGMGERVAAIGGTLHAGVVDGRFVVSARLPRRGVLAS